MNYKLTAIYFKNEGWYVGYCLQIPEANGQGKTLLACKRNLSSAIELIMAENAKDLIQFLPIAYRLEPLLIDEKKISTAIAYGKRMQNTAGRQRALNLDKYANRKKRSRSST